MKSPKKPTTRKSKSAVINQEVVNEIPVEQPELVKIDDLTEKSSSSISEGLGDTVAKITTALGIKPCEACIKRREILNNSYRYLQISRDVTEEEGLFIQRLNKTPGYINDPDIKPLFALYNSLFRKTLSPCRCGGVINQIITLINKSFKYHSDDN